MMNAKLLAALDSQAVDDDALYGSLARLLAAHAPANGCCLPGAVGEVIAALAAEWGLTLADDPRLRSSGSLAIEIGGGQGVDLVIAAHADRPSFRVLSAAESTLYPLCAIRIPHDDYRCAAKALRFQDGQLRVTARGTMQIKARAAGHHIRFHSASGSLNWGDTVMMDANPRRRGGQVIGTGLDNAAGVLTALLAARALLALHAELAERGRKILFVFTDQEEGPPSGLFGQGAARLTHSLPPPRLGFINVDAHNADPSRGHLPGIGASHAFVSGWGRGSVVPLEYQARAEALAAAVNEQRAATVHLNYGYVSRSDDMLLSLWARCLALIGMPLVNAHTTRETIALGDIAAARRWLSVFAGQLLAG